MSHTAKILIVNDDKHVRQSVDSFCQSLGFESVCAENGQAGLHLLEAQNPDLILLDLEISDMNGLDILAQSRKIVPDTPVIAIAEKKLAEKMVQALKLGACDCLKKPIHNFSILEHSIKEALDKARLIKENQDYQFHLEKMVKNRTAELEKVNSNLTLFNNRLHSLVETIGGLALCKDMVQYPGLVLEKFSAQIEADGGSLYVVNEHGLRLMAAIDPGHAAISLPFPLPAGSILHQVLAQKKPLLVKDITQVEDIRPSSWHGYTDGSLLSFPVLDASGGQVEAVISLHSRQNAPFTEQDKEIGTILASYSSETLRAVRAFYAVQKSEVRYRTLFEKSNDAIFIVDKHTGQYRDCNKAGAALVGRPINEIRKLTRNDLTAEVEASQGRRQGTRRAPSHLLPPETVMYLRPDSTRRPAKVNIVPLDKQLEIEIARDISQDLEMERQLRHSRKMEAIGTLAGGIAHDFNNILSGILGYSQLVEIHADNPEAVKRNLAQVIKGAARAGELVQQILTFSRQVEHEPKPLRLYLIVKEAVKFLRSSIPSSIEIIEKITSRNQVMADATQVHQVIINLCTNAYHAIGDHCQGRMTVALEDIELDQTQARHGCDPGRYVRLRVADTGKGIDQSIIDRIFDPYFTTKEMSQGTGLGLAVVDGIVKKHNGFIRVNTQADHGTEFSVFFPEADMAVNTAEDRPASRELVKGSGHVLLVEDEVPILDTVCKILEKIGYQVDDFLDGKSAMTAFEQDPHRYDIVITDMSMPQMNGRDLARGILALRPDMPIILCTGFHETFTREKALKEGIRRYIQKPVTGRELSVIIKEEICGRKGR